MNDMQRVAYAFDVIESRMDDFDQWDLIQAVEYLGPNMRAFAQLETAWLNNVHISELVAAVELERVRVKGGFPQRVLWLADLLGGLSRAVSLYGLSVVLEFMVQRQSIFSVDPRPLLASDNSALSSAYHVYDLSRSAGSLRSAVISLNRWATNPQPILAAAGLNSEDLQTLEAFEERNAPDVEALLSGVIAVPSELDETVKQLEAQPAFELIQRLRSQGWTVEFMLRRAVNSDASFEPLFALGTYLAVTGRARDALPLLEAADRQAPEEDRIGCRFMLVDCLRALGGPEATAGLQEIVAPSLAPMETLWEGDWDYSARDLFLVVRGLATSLGAVEPFSSSRLMPDADESLGTEHPRDYPVAQVSTPVESTEALLQAFRANQELMRVWQEQSLTEIGSLKSEFRATNSRELFLMERLAENLPTRRRLASVKELKSSVRNWSTLPKIAQDLLVTGHYLGGDPALISVESSTAIVSAVCGAVEVSARSLLGLGERATLGNAVGFLSEHHPGSQLIPPMERTNELRRRAAHGRGDLTRADVDEVWAIVLGAAPIRGLIDLLVESAAT